MPVSKAANKANSANPKSCAPPSSALRFLGRLICNVRCTKGLNMTAYVILRITVHDSEKLKAYQKAAPSIIEQYEGKLLARGGEVISLEGPTDKRRTVIIEFPTMEKAKSFYLSPEYTEAIILRKGAAEFEVIAVEGLA